MAAKETQMELFGNTDQQAMMRRGAALRQLTKGDPQFSYYGRNVALTEFSSDAVDMVESLSLVQGASSCFYVPVRQAGNFRSSLDQHGFTTDQFENWQGKGEPLVASQTIVDQRQLPDDLDVVNICPDTPDNIIAALDKVTQSCGVLLPFGKVMRGLDTPSVCMLAIDRDGAPVASAASVASNHPKGVHGEEAWWGLLATREDRRGEGIAIIMGAMAMLSMYERHGYSAFMTGVRNGNIASEKLCQKLGLSCGNFSVVAALDPQQFAGGSMTK